MEEVKEEVVVEKRKRGRPKRKEGEPIIHRMKSRPKYNHVRKEKVEKEPKKYGPKPKSVEQIMSELKPEEQPKRKAGRPRLYTDEERAQRLRARMDERNAKLREKTKNNSTKRFRKKKEKMPARLSKYFVRPIDESGRTISDSNRDAWLIMKEAARGKSFQEIAQWMSELDGYRVTPKQVYASVRRAMVEWKKENIKHVDEFIAYEIGKLEALEEMLLADYEKSRIPKPRDYAALMGQGMTMEEIDEWYEKKGGLPGDPSLLDRVMQINLRKMRMLGIESGNDVTTTTIVNYGFDMKDLGELSEIVGRMQDRKREDMYSEANVVEEVKEEENEDGQRDD